MEERIKAYPCSGEINYRVADAPATVARIEAHYANSVTGTHPKILPPHLVGRAGEGPCGAAEVSPPSQLPPPAGEGLPEREAITVDRTDGLSMDFGTWRFNLRSSNTEPLLRLNVEARGDARLMQQKTQELEMLITT